LAPKWSTLINHEGKKWMEPSAIKAKKKQKKKKKEDSREISATGNRKKKEHLLLRRGETLKGGGRREARANANMPNDQGHKGGRRLQREKGGDKRVDRRRNVTRGEKLITKRDRGCYQYWGFR